MNKQLLNRINKNLYDLENIISTVSIIKQLNSLDIDIKLFTKNIQLYINNFYLLEKVKEENLLILLDEKLSFIIRHIHNVSLYPTEIDASINFIKKHTNTFFPSIEENKINTKCIKENILTLEAIKIKNYFSLEDIKITNLKNKKEIYFVGENGDGKTILLQAILLGLKTEYSPNVIEHIKSQKDMEISVKDEFSTEYSEKIDMKNVFAYGINRNKMDYREFDEYGYSGLFDTSRASKTTYLKDPFNILGKEYEGDNSFIKEFIEKLNTVILRENYQLFNTSDVDFNELSEGYKSTVIWLYDLVSRLIENQQERDEVKELKDFKGIVLIDEVDLYLHPKWKYDFVNNLREVFPNIQFIMITHSMVTILGAREDAVFYKVYKEEGETKISQPMNNIKNLMANSLSTSPLFDMDTARARYNDNKLDTREDFISSKIHTIIKERTQSKKAIIEDEIIDMINQELDDYLKENDL